MGKRGRASLRRRGGGRDALQKADGITEARHSGRLGALGRES